MRLNSKLRMHLSLVCTSAFLLVGAAHAEEHSTYVSVAAGEVVTGANRLLGQPLYAYDFAPNPTFGFNTVDEFDPSGDLPIPLSQTSSRDVVLATTFPNLAAVPAPVLPNINIPLRSVGTYVNGLLDRAPVPFHLDANAPVVGPTQAEPSSPNEITLRDWLRGRGLAISRCGPAGNFASILVSRLIPNRMYSVVGLWLNEDGSFRPVSFGGVPNVIMTDASGKGLFKRRMNFCPATAATEGIGSDHLIGVAVLLHSAHVAWGAIPTPSAEGFVLPPGSILHGHIWFDLGAGRALTN